MHQPVLLEEVIELMGIKPGGRYIDGTVGGGGHAGAILEKAGFGGRLLGIDRDAAALARTAERLSTWGSGCALEQGDFADMIAMAERHDLKDVDGVLLDLGMSSDQVDSPERGFSFLQDGPLDMRMDFTQELTAEKLVNESDERTLADILWRLGEEPASRRIAKVICAERDRRRIETTGHLAEIVSEAKGGRRGRIHPATKTFQALRMAVNSELESLETGLEAALSLVAPGGRVAIISFHSLEDRVVKHGFARHVGKWESLPAGGRRWIGDRPVARWITRKPVMASDKELTDNPRARSAKLRVVERVD
jgi:16S rRNA (cytosine1402-N4)-methyltransferase